MLVRDKKETLHFNYFLKALFKSVFIIAGNHTNIAITTIYISQKQYPV